MSTKSKSIGFVVEGVGRTTPTSGSSKGICWYWGQSSLNGTVTDSYEWIGGHGAQAGLLSLPQTVGTQVDPFDVTIQGSAFSFQLHKSDLAGELWLAKQSAAEGYIGQALTDTATSVQLSSSTYNYGAADEGTVVWVGDEAILLGTFDAGNGVFTTCTRGYYSTIAQTLPTGMSVYRRNPYREKRRVLLLEYDHETSTTSTLWQGFVTDFDASGPTVRVQTVELLSILRRGIINRDAEDLTDEGRIFSVGSSDGYTYNAAVKMANDTPNERRVNKHSIDSTHWIALQLGGGLFWAFWTSGIALFEDNDGTYAGGSNPALGSSFDAGEWAAFEVFAIDEAKDRGTALAATRSSSHDFRTTIGDNRPFHPLNVIMAFFTSGYDDGVGPSNGDWDKLGYRWGLGVPADWFDTTAISTLISSTIYATIEQMVLGWDGEPVEFWPVMRDILRTFGMFIGINESGQITFAQLRLATVADKCSSNSISPIPYDLDWTPAEGEGVDQLRGRIGELPWSDGQRYEANSLGDTELLKPHNSFRSGVFGDVEAFNLDLPFKRSQESVSETGELVSLATMRGLGAPRLTIRVNQGDYAIGDMLEVGDPGLRDNWFHDENGTTVTPDGSVQWYGQVVGIQHDLGNSTQLLTLLMTNYWGGAFLRFRAPSGETSDTFEGTGTGGGGSNEYPISVDLGTSGTPAALFAAGDKVELWKPDGARRSGTAASPDIRTIQSVGASVIELDSDFSTTGVAGDVIRLAKLGGASGYPADGNPNTTINGVTIDCALAYVFMSDDDETLSTSDEDAHVYGGAI